MTLLNQHSALITGAGQGIGRGIALQLAAAGADVVIADIDLAAAEKVVYEASSLGVSAMAVAMDVTDTNVIDKTVKQAVARFPDIGILVNNAGAMQQHFSQSTTLDDFTLCHHVNVAAIWSVTQALLPQLKTQGNGRIINIASTGGRIGSAETPAYSAAKAAAINLTQSQSLALAPFDITVNAVCPGLVWTPMWASIETLVNKKACVEDRETFNQAVNTTPLQRPITPDDIGHAVVFFASDRARNITGQALNINAGSLMN